MTAKKKQLRTDPETGHPDWGEGHVHGWDWERNCPIPQAERTLTNLLLGTLYAYRQGDKGTAGKILFTKVNGEFAWELLRDGLERLAETLCPEEPSQEVNYPLSPYDVRDEVERKCSELGSRPVKWEMKATKDKWARMAWVWSVGDWRAVEILGGGQRKARWLDALPEFVPAHAKGLKPDHSRHEQEREVAERSGDRAKADDLESPAFRQGVQEEKDRVAREDAAERAAIQAAQRVGEDLEQRLRHAEAQPKVPTKRVQPRPTNGNLPGADWLLRFDSVDPLYGKARAAKHLKGCELCLAVIDAGQQWVASSKGSGKRAHAKCYEIRRAKLENERINAP